AAAHMRIFAAGGAELLPVRAAGRRRPVEPRVGAGRAFAAGQRARNPGARPRRIIGRAARRSRARGPRIVAAARARSFFRRARAAAAAVTFAVDRAAAAARFIVCSRAWVARSCAAAAVTRLLRFALEGARALTEVAPSSPQAALAVSERVAAQPFAAAAR